MGGGHPRGTVTHKMVTLGTRAPKDGELLVWLQHPWQWGPLWRAGAPLGNGHPGVPQGGCPGKWMPWVRGVKWRHPGGGRTTEGCPKVGAWVGAPN